MVVEPESNDDTLPLAAFIGGLAPASACYTAVVQDHAGALIGLGLRNLLAHSRTRLVDAPRDGSLIIAGGGDSTMDAPVVERLAELLDEAPAAPVVVLPSSFEEPPAALAALLATRTAPVSLYLREQSSRDLA